MTPAPPRMIKYPRTPHVEGSRLQPGDEDMDAVRFSALRDAHLVVEEKVDGANAGVRFDEHGRLWLQSRGHFLVGGAREKHFNLFKQWAETHRAALYAVLGPRYALYGEWLFAKHTVFYDRLPHYFLEYDVFDTETTRFLSTVARRRLLEGAPLVSVPVLFDGALRSHAALVAHVGPSRYKSPSWRASLTAAALRAGIDAERGARETDPSDEMEGLYIKAENADHVVARYKYVRAGFLTAVVDSGSHWLSRPIVQNELAPSVDIFGATHSLASVPEREAP
jgi:hypothetical protein